MNKEIISSKQFQFLIFTFGLGSYLLFNIGSDAKQDAWISSIIATILCLVTVSVYGKIMSYYPGKNIFEVLKLELGKVTGLVLSIMFLLYIFLLGSYIFNDFIDFIKVTALSRTPDSILIICIGLLSIWILQLGIQVVAAWADFLVKIILVFVILSWILLIPQMHLFNIQPIFFQNSPYILKEAIKIWAFPMNEVIIFLSFFDCMKNDTNIKTVFLKPIIFSGIIAVIFILTNISILGGNTYETSYYSGYEVAKRLKIGGEFQRIEIIVSATFTIIQFLEISYCLLGVTKGFKSLFNLVSYRNILIPLGFLIMNFTYIIFRSSLKAIQFATGLWIPYCLFMQVLLPVIILCIMWCKRKFNRYLHKTDIN
ncbi:GerAB/ArcD/ProY family transporter [Clostridium botulinum]|uniref:GerAB/ArcD/ProY family transporter n=1 Tax=Clostridium botulinum TaxID=1491 RepID=UPI0004D775BB|nr:endospore germination permease [Clostridium botulinum]KEI01532.1 spore gernimation protein KB [Clostridium botulinum C/D str. BKT75002]KEI07866.1 spore gernimation protein KB [Clostridium botulinum C/D str. BKT2873]MCD3349526.1 endospore germination permease [Clostridium botulinum D/C]MCD3358483.1 endospore germination permease [Clostridium botulinum D/C]MCD3362978.1 endospore germination permease [Clostridium botulinum D/C]